MISYVHCTYNIFLIPRKKNHNRDDVDKTYRFKNMKVFMEDYLKCFVGDRNLKGYEDSDFEDLRVKYQADNILYFALSRNANKF
jgi:hypothetical protein